MFHYLKKKQSQHCLLSGYLSTGQMEIITSGSQRFFFRAMTQLQWVPLHTPYQFQQSQDCKAYTTEDLSFFFYDMEDLRYAAVGIKEAKNQSRSAELEANLGRNDVQS